MSGYQFTVGKFIDYVLSFCPLAFVFPLAVKRKMANLVEPGG